MFTNVLSDEFLSQAIIHNLELAKIDTTRIIFKGILTKPETDWTVDFTFIYNLPKNTFYLQKIE